MPKRLVLDTNIIRTLIENEDEPSWLACLQECREDGWSITLADGTYVEIICQLFEKRLDWSKWQARRERFEKLLDPSMPVLPGNTNLMELAGVLIAGRKTKPTLNELKTHSYYSWNHLMRAESLRKWRDGRQFKMDGKTFSTMIDKTKLKLRQLLVRRQWIEDFLRPRSPSDPMSFQDSDDEKTMISKAQAMVDSLVSTAPPLSDRLDAAIRVYVQFHRMRLNKKSRYAVESDKRRGDIFDFGLLDPLILPDVIILTTDGKFVNRVRATKTPQATRLLLIKEFEDLVRSGKLKDLLK